MDEAEDKPIGPQTQPPSDGLRRLARLGEELQGLAGTLSEEWARSDEARSALAQVLAERQEQHEVAKERVVELEARAADLQVARDAEAGRSAALEAQAREAAARASELQRGLDAERARAQEDRAALEAAAAQERVAADELRARAAELEGRAAPSERVQELEQKLAEAEAARGAQAARADEAQQELEALKRAGQAASEQVQASGAELESLRARVAAAEQERDEQKLQVEGLMRQADGERARWQEERSGISAERYQALSELSQLREKAAELEAQLQRASGASSTEADELRAHKARLEAELQAAGTQAEGLRQAAETAGRDLQAAKVQINQLADEAATLKAERSLLHERLDAAEQARVAVEADRDRAKAETSPLWATIESLQRQITQERERSESRLAEGPENLRAELQDLKERLEAEIQARAKATRWAEQVEAEASRLRERTDTAQKTLKSSLAALRRTPFVPPTLRVTLAELDSESGEAPKKPRGQRLLFLDRDPLSVEALANSLEHHGVDVLVAHYADEVSFFIKTPEARAVTALVADVMAFRSDQDMVERCKVWRQDLGNTTLVLSYRTDNPVEAERARQVPGSLNILQVSRTIGPDALMDTLSRRHTRPPENPSGVFRIFKR